jgi:ribulose-phosphate 3-epimerase
MYILSPSILAADFGNLANDIEIIDKAGAQYVHVDIMDGIFVPSISMGMPVMQSIRKATNRVFDVHLMITEPIRYIEEFKKAGADIITVHAEACHNLPATLDKIREVGCKVGVSINPHTNISAIEGVLDKVDMVLIMSVHPGFGGQKFIPESLDKIRELKSMLDEKDLEVDIQVDGGIYTSNVEEVVKAGANIIVAGSAIFRGDVAQNTKDMLSILEKYE